jgi:hypothetical protein
VCPEVLFLQPLENYIAALTGGLAEWLDEAACGRVCTEIDGHDVLPLYGWLLPMDPDLEPLIDRLLVGPIIEWSPPAAAALRRREHGGGGTSLGASQAARIADWSARHCEQTARRWQALAGLVLASRGNLHRFEAAMAEHGEALGLDPTQAAMCHDPVPQVLRLSVTQTHPNEYFGCW